MLWGQAPQSCIQIVLRLKPSQTAGATWVLVIHSLSLFHLYWKSLVGLSGAHFKDEQVHLKYGQVTSKQKVFRRNWGLKCCCRRWIQSAWNDAVCKYFHSPGAAPKALRRGGRVGRRTDQGGLTGSHRAWSRWEGSGGWITFHVLHLHFSSQDSSHGCMWLGGKYAVSNHSRSKHVMWGFHNRDSS